MATLVITAAVVLVTASYLFALAASERFTGAHRLLPLAITLIIVTSVSTILTYLFAPMWWILVWIIHLAAATPLVVVKLTRTYPRARIRTLLLQRLIGVLGTDWGQQLAITFTADNKPTTVSTTLPAAMIPSEITPKLKSVIGETLGGTWSLSTKGTHVTATKLVIKPEPKYLRALKDVVLAPKAFTSQATISDVHLGDDDAVRTFTVTYGLNIASDIAMGNRRKSIEKQIRESLPAGTGSWSFKWAVPQKQCVIARSMFKRRIDHKLTTTPVKTLAEAAANYSDLAIGLGIDETGELVAWRLDGDSTPHGIMFGATGGGKSSVIGTIITEGSPAGACYITADFKGDNEYNRFRTWPGMHLVAQDFYSGLRAIVYVEELLDLRLSGGQTPKNGPDPKVPIILIIDELAAGLDALRKIWPRLRADNPALPPEPPIVTALQKILRLGRSLHVHVFTATQRATADNFPTEFKHNSQLKIQAGWCDGTTSQNFWDDFEIGQTVPVKTPGRCLIRGADGFVQFQGFYTPNPTDRDLTADEAAILDELHPDISLYPRMLIDMPDADKIHSWHQIATAPIVPAQSRPDLDPESPDDYVPRKVVTVDTVSNVVDPNTMQLKDPSPSSGRRDVPMVAPADPAEPDILDENEAAELGDDEPAEKPAPKPRKSTRKSGPPQLTVVRSIQGEQQQPRRR
ncbi:FtsK/SpoIIIE family protein [Mycolicibacterium fortuitum subsp. acetamidolyticum]|uniref:FtsK/SpoIIIE family protein n=1 Tax=Mycolicibacterium fortuitum subsp. acetamidolyticum TaxID=144550 RepID=A0A117IDD7_MYCFO|nr:hypothetical protein [Mycolicibacterium fortuitum]MCV7137875.1 hypothetical protein [Mycolicibacterium fortuitum]GAT00955.1 FtsK/SpoIIIE family protein [Mycolicibacterium fortuitum subsp. acetamidolyticum]